MNDCCNEKLRELDDWLDRFDFGRIGDSVDVVELRDKIKNLLDVSEDKE